MKTLIVVNVAVFVLCSITSRSGSLLSSPVFQFGVLYTPATLSGQIWRLITAQYLHWSFGHIFMNMLGLYFLGNALEREWGTRRFLVIYTLAGLLGNVFYTVLSRMGYLPIDGVAAGASGCVLGLLGACAVRYPQAEVYVYFLFPIKIRTAALVFGGWYVLNLFNRGPNAGGDACHLAGLIFGTWWALRGESWWSRVTGHRYRLRPTSRGAASGNRPTYLKDSGFAQKVSARRTDEKEIDRILKKVYEGGIHSLTEAEKHVLRDATERQREREAKAGRIDRL